MIIPISQDINKFFVNINGTQYPVKKMLFNGQGVQNVEVYADYYSQYFTIESLEDGNEVTFTIAKPKTGSINPTSFYHSVDGGVTWTDDIFAINYRQYVTINVDSGDKILFKVVTNTYGLNINPSSLSSISSTKNIKAYGNIMSLFYGADFEDKTTLPGNYACLGLFAGNTKLIDISNLKLPATTLTYYCYKRMFQGCTSLTVTPELPATTLTESCYASMFNRCTSLVSAPVLPATTLATHCYEGMFSGCSSLVSAPVLPATTLANYCYSEMFSRCTALVNAPVLPATTLTENCYYSMFYGCTSLLNAPELPALTLTQYCYNSMFWGCSSINRIVCLATDISANECVGGWLRDVSSTGTFYKNSSMSSWTTGVSGIPSNWTVVNW